MLHYNPSQFSESKIPSHRSSPSQIRWAFLLARSSNRTKTLSGSVVTTLIVRPAITFVSFWFLRIIYWPVPPAGEYPRSSASNSDMNSPLSLCRSIVSLVSNICRSACLPRLHWPYLPVQSLSRGLVQWEGSYERISCTLRSSLTLSRFERSRGPIGRRWQFWTCSSPGTGA